MGIYEDRVKRLREHVLAQQKKAEKPAELTNKELMAMLDELGVEYEKKATKPILITLLEQAQGQADDPEAEPEDDDEGR